jgi:hypothetical protein
MIGEKASSGMLPTIDAILGLFSKRRRDTDTLNQVIDNLHRSDEELELRLRRLRDQVDVYQRTTRREGEPDG